jgi:hypothetical protein
MMSNAKRQSPTRNCLFQTAPAGPYTLRNIEQSLALPCQVNGAAVLVHAPDCLWQVSAFQHVCRCAANRLCHLIAADQDPPMRLCTLLYGASVSGSLSCDDLADVP